MRTAYELSSIYKINLKEENKMKKTREISIQTEELNEETICCEQKFILLMSKILKELEQQK